MDEQKKVDFIRDIENLLLKADIEKGGGFKEYRRAEKLIIEMCLDGEEWIVAMARIKEWCGL
jgi:hypothetical protein